MRLINLLFLTCAFFGNIVKSENPAETVEGKRNCCNCLNVKTIKSRPFLKEIEKAKRCILSREHS